MKSQVVKSGRTEQNRKQMMILRVNIVADRWLESQSGTQSSFIVQSNEDCLA